MKNLNKNECLELLVKDLNKSSMVDSVNFCINLLNKIDNNFMCDNSMTSTNTLNKGELVEAIVKYVLGINTLKSQARAIDLEELNIEIKYATRTSYACNCEPKTQLVMLVNTKNIYLVNKEQLIKNAKGRISPNFKGQEIKSDLVNELREKLGL